MTFFNDTFSTPFGPFSVAVGSCGALIATAFGPRDRLSQRLTFRTSEQKSHLTTSNLIRDKELTREVRDQVLAYCAGERCDFSVELAPLGTTFQRRVWAALRAIPFGATRSYGQLAAELGDPAASRAVGRANATNPNCLIVPCHRVIGADGSLTGFAFGEELKYQLLEHERLVLARSRAA